MSSSPKRARRAASSRLTDTTSSALEQLKRLKQENASRFDDYTVKEERIYDEVDDETYQEIVRRRQKEDDFVVDDNGLGYADNGLEDWDRVSQGTEESFSEADEVGLHGKSKRKKSKNTANDKKPQNELGKKDQRINAAFAKAKVGVHRATTLGTGFSLNDTQSDNLMQSLMAEFDAGTKAPPNATFTAHHQKPFTAKTNSTLTASTIVPTIKIEPVASAVSTGSCWESSFADDLPPSENIVEMSDAPSEPVVAPPAARTFAALRQERGLPDPMEQNPFLVPGTSELLPSSQGFPSSQPIVSSSQIPVTESSFSQLSFTVETEEAAQETSQPLNSTIDSASLLEQDGSLSFYWLDAHEKQNGIVYLFGKVLNKSLNAFVSCCVAVHELERNIFILPREKKLDSFEDVTTADVYQEFDQIATKFRISKYRCKTVTRKYAFELANIPSEAEYLKVVYPFSNPVLPRDLTGKTFSHMFGTNTSALEMVLIKRRMMGPCWLRIEDPLIQKRNYSWCKVEVDCKVPKNVKVMPEDQAPPLPPLVVLSLNMRTVHNREKHCNEIVAFNCLVFKNVSMEGQDVLDSRKCSNSFTAVRQLNATTPFPFKFQEQLQRAGMRVEMARNERALLNFLMLLMQRVDPDVIVGHNVIGFDVDVLLHRMKALKVDHWSRLGRLHLNSWPKMSGDHSSQYAERLITAGRLLCDTYLAAKDSVKSKNYSLQTLSLNFLKVERTEMDYEQIPSLFQKGEDLLFLLRHCEMDASLAVALMTKLQILPLTKQLTSLAGNLWSRTLTGARAERNEYLLLHEFHQLKYICPDKSFKVTAPAVDAEDDEEGGAAVVSRKGRRKPAYAGGLVLEPKKGFYDKIVLLLDFNSLYPSLIREHNICFTTVERRALQDGDENNADEMPNVPDKNCAMGILPKLLGNLVARRQQVKQLMKNKKLSPLEYAQLDIRQKALKLTANSMYGCLGFTHSRFYAKPLAMLITAKGRETLQDTVNLAQEQCRLQVVYGDTDSIMIDTGTDQVEEAKKMAQLVKRSVNEKYRLLEIELDGMFQKLLLLKKKKYAAVVLEETSPGVLVTHVETKGLDLVRRDWCALSVDCSNFVLNRILSGESRELIVENIHQHLTQLAQEVREQRVPLDKFIIHKSINKAPEEYADAKTQPHVQVALQMKQRGKMIRAGDTIPFVICEQQEKGSLAQRAFDPESVRKENRVIDIEWYLMQQVHPPVARLCEHIQGTDAAHIASCLGLDAQKFKHSQTLAEDEEFHQAFASLLSEEVRFQSVHRFSVKCPFCKEEFDFQGPIRENKETGQCSDGFSCPNETCKAPLPCTFLVYRLHAEARQQQIQYYQSWLQCDDAACRQRVRPDCVYAFRCPMTGCRGTLTSEYNERMIYQQMAYYRHLLNYNFWFERYKGKKEQILLESTLPIYKPLYALAEQLYQSCGSGFYDLNAVFDYARKSSLMR